MFYYQKIKNYKTFLNSHLMYIVVYMYASPCLSLGQLFFWHFPLAELRVIRRFTGRKCDCIIYQ